MFQRAPGDSREVKHLELLLERRIIVDGRDRDGGRVDGIQFLVRDVGAVVGEDIVPATARERRGPVAILLGVYKSLFRSAVEGDGVQVAFGAIAFGGEVVDDVSGDVDLDDGDDFPSSGCECYGGATGDGVEVKMGVSGVVREVDI